MVLPTALAVCFPLRIALLALRHGVLPAVMKTVQDRA